MNIEKLLSGAVFLIFICIYAKKSVPLRPIWVTHRKMSRFITCLAALCLAVGMMAQEAEEPVIITAPDTVINKTAYSFTEQGITIAVSYGSAYPAGHSFNNLDRTYFACLAGGNITFSAEQNIKGLAINGWVKKNFSATCNNGIIDYLSDDAEDTTGEPVLTVSDIDATSVTISCNNQLRCFSVEVYFLGNPEGTQGEVMDTVRFTAVTAEAADYSNDPTYSSEGYYSYWLNLAPAEGYPQVWLDMYAAVQGDLSGEYSLYNYNVGDYTYIQLSADELDYEYAYDQAFTITHINNGYHVEGYIIADNDIQYEFVYNGPITLTEVVDGVENVESQTPNNQSEKVLRDGQVLIHANGEWHTISGVKMQ